MVAGEINAAIVLCITASIAVIPRKSKCFLREDGSGNVSWGIEYTDRPIEHKTSHVGDETSVRGAPSEEHRNGRSLLSRLE